MAVMKRIEWLRGKMCRPQGVVLFFVVSWTAMALASPRSCELIRKDIEVKGFFSELVLDKPENGLICGEGSCCSSNLEESMVKYSQSYMEKYLKDSILRVSSLIETRAKKFDEIFRDMMNNSKREFHNMFERTYGKIYLQNSEVFSDFFNELETYYKKGTVRLSETMDTFFGILYQRMFTVLNAQYNFDDKYLECVAEHMVETNPFDDVPHKLGQQIRRSFVAARTFYKSLTRGAEAARAVATLRVDEECRLAIARMQFCGVCRGEVGAGACSGFCVDTVSACLRHQMHLSDAWDGFVDAVEKVAERLIGPYNIGSVVEPLNIKISEAVMNFQESGTAVSEKIYSKCGKPSLLTRPKRKAGYETPPEDNPNMEIRYEPMKMGNGKKKHKKVQEKVDTTPKLDKLIAEIKVKVKDTKQFWIQLPYQYCNNQTISASPSENGECWNGTTIGTYNEPKPKITPSEIPIINEQNYILNGLTEKLRKAYQGMEVEIIDDTEETFAGSGSGSGNGDDEEETPEENEEDKDISFNGDVRKIGEVYPTSPPSSSTATPEVVRTSSANTNSMSLTRALIQYLLPMVMVWFGGAIKDLL